MQVPSVLDIHPIAPLVAAKEVVKKTYTTIFDKKFSIGPWIKINPFEGLIAGYFAFLALLYAQIFIDTFRAKEEPKVMSSLVLVEKEIDKNHMRVVCGLNFLGALSRFFDWGADRGWFFVQKVTAVGLKALASVTGVVSYAYQAMQAMQRMEEFDRIAKIGALYKICQKEVFETGWYSACTNFMANFVFMSYSGLQLVNACMGIVIASEITSALLLAGVVLFVSSYFFHLCDNSAFECDRVRLLDPKMGATGSYRYSFLVE